LPVTFRGQRAWLRVSPFLEHEMSRLAWRGTADAAAVSGVCKPSLLHRIEWHAHGPSPVLVSAEVLNLVTDPVARARYAQPGRARLRGELNGYCEPEAWRVMRRVLRDSSRWRLLIPQQAWRLLEKTGILYSRRVTQSMEALERQIEALRAEVRHATRNGDRVRARAMRAELRDAEHAWDEALTRLEEQSPPVPGLRTATQEAGPLLPVREQVHQALTLLGAPAAQRLIIAVHDAFSGSSLVPARLTSLRRDEERSFRSAPYARPYYLCAALTADLLAPARGLLAVSTWPVERRVIGPLSPRVNYLEAAIRVAENLLRVPEPGTAATRLLRRFAANIPGASRRSKPGSPQVVAAAARAELDVHVGEDLATRRAAAARARAQLDDVEQLFGSRMRAMPGTGTGG